MKALIYINSDKDPQGVWSEKLTACFNKYGVEFSFIDKNSLCQEQKADAIFALGGDGTLLSLTKVACDNNIPIIGINAGKLGFLTEFERFETEEAVKLFVENQLIEDKRLLLSVDFKGESHYALNDVFVQRMYREESSSIISINVAVDNEIVDKVTGDGVIISTPTGSTAYSLSAGGAVLCAGINACQITPIASHSFNQRPIIYNANSSLDVSMVRGDGAGLFVDGKFISSVCQGDKLNVNLANKQLTFLRRKEYSFFKRLTDKMKVGEKE